MFSSIFYTASLLTGTRQHCTCKSHFPLFVTPGSLTFDFTISPYTATLLLSSFMYFTLQVYPQTEARRILQPPHPLASNGRNIRLGGPLPLLAMGVPPEGYRSRSTVEPTQVITGHFFEDPDQDYCVHNPLHKA